MHVNIIGTSSLAIIQSHTILVAIATVTTEIPVLLHTPMSQKHLFEHKNLDVIREKGVEGY